MLTAINFHDQESLAAGKVSEVRSDRKLAHEFVPRPTPCPQFAPQCGFGIILDLF